MAYLRMLIVRFAARLIHQMDVIDDDVVRDGFGHIINSQAGDANGG